MSEQHEKVACKLLGHLTRPARDEEDACTACGVVVCAACELSGYCPTCLEEQIHYDEGRRMAEEEYEEEERERGRERARERAEEELDHIKFWRRGF